MKTREEKIEVLKSYVNVNGYIYEHDIEAIADELAQQPAKELFEKVYIRSEEDLPEEDGRYYVHNRGNINEYDLHDSTWLGNMYKEAWLRDYDFYLRPLE